MTPTTTGCGSMVNKWCLFSECVISLVFSMILSRHSMCYATLTPLRVLNDAWHRSTLTNVDTAPTEARQATPASVPPAQPAATDQPAPPAPDPRPLDSAATPVASETHIPLPCARFVSSDVTFPICIGTRWRCMEGHEWVTAHCDTAWFAISIMCRECGKAAVAQRGEWGVVTFPPFSRCQHLDLYARIERVVMEAVYAGRTGHKVAEMDGWLPEWRAHMLWDYMEHEQFRVMVRSIAEGLISLEVSIHKETKS